ncbi:short-chain dehydrogenase/reductase [Thozetella sp. PMI_491]|nr:short-chain dehydrogenase/reductase [Thozetella sp. PMI_491]
MSEEITSLASVDLFSVRGLVAVVTGGATGIGLMMSKALEENGAKVYIVGRRKEVLERVAKEEGKYGNIFPLAGDVTSKDDLSRIVAQITSEVGYINLLVANAGIEGPSKGPDITLGGPNPSPLADVQARLWATDPVAFNQVLAVNTGGVYWSIVAFLDLLDKGNREGNVVQSSQIIGVSSVGGFNRLPFVHYAYSASKAGVTHMLKQFASTLVQYGIRVNTIAPGVFPSQITHGIIDASRNLPPAEWAARFAPVPRLGNPDDMAGIILWLASRAGAWLSGNVVVVDGGKLSVVPSTY